MITQRLLGGNERAWTDNWLRYNYVALTPAQACAAFVRYNEGVRKLREANIETYSRELERFSDFLRERHIELIQQ